MSDSHSLQLTRSLTKKLKRRFTLPRSSTSSPDISATNWNSPTSPTFSRSQSSSVSDGSTGPTCSVIPDRISFDGSGAALYDVDLARRHATRGSRHSSVSMNSSSTSVYRFEDTDFYPRSSQDLTTTLSSPPLSAPSTPRIMQDPTFFEEEAHDGYSSYGMPGIDVDVEPEQSQADEMARKILEQVNGTSGVSDNRDIWWI
ncbi:uncharacterized protein V1513DRAFT_196170 [Lipomyces chichibuensis]|uniref:uncharacterized protein n=1 Tax=Lipomyces chichibuensis TaxID=1546026 RepID=UPI003344059F